MTNKNKDQEKIPEAVVEACRLLGTAVENCGIMLDNAFEKCNFLAFDYNDRGFETYHGKARGLLSKKARKGDKAITLNRGDSFSRNTRLLIYNEKTGNYQVTRVRNREGNRLELTGGLKTDYPRHSRAVALSQFRCEFDGSRQTLLQRIDSGKPGVIIKDVTDFSVEFHPEEENVYLGISLKSKEKISAYFPIFNLNGGRKRRSTDRKPTIKDLAVSIDHTLKIEVERFESIWREFQEWYAARNIASTRAAKWEDYRTWQLTKDPNVIICNSCDEPGKPDAICESCKRKKKGTSKKMPIRILLGECYLPAGEKKGAGQDLK